MSNCHTVKQLPQEERPRERLRYHGAENMATAELLAVIIGSGTKGKSVLLLSQELLSYFGSLKNIAEASIESLCQIRGLGPAKAIQVKAALTLGKRLQNPQQVAEGPIISGIQIYRLVKGFLQDKKQETLYVLLQDTRLRVFHREVISMGTLTQVLMHPREIFHAAIHHLAASIILAHNHPNGDPRPSAYDYALTKKVILASRAVGIPLYDHVIIGGGTYISFRERGLFS